MTVAIFPANCPFGISSRLLSLQNNASSVELSTIQILENLVKANLMLSGKGR